MRLGLFASAAIAGSIWIAPASADVTKILDGVAVKPLTRDASKSLKAKGTYADYYGYYGMLYGYYAYYYGYYGYAYKSSDYYYTAYTYASAATNYLYYGYYYQYYGY